MVVELGGTSLVYDH